MIDVDILGPSPKVPAALRNDHRRDLLRRLAGMVVMAPVWLLVLFLVPAEVLRYGLSLLALGLLVVLLKGMRYWGAVTKPMLHGIGASGGFWGGCRRFAGAACDTVLHGQPTSRICDPRQCNGLSVHI